MRTTLPVLVVTLFVSACTDPAPPGPIAGTFEVEAHFVGRVQKGFACTANGCVINEDTTAIDGAGAGKVTFDTLTQSIESSSVTLSLGECAYCLVNPGRIGHAWRRGDSVEVRFGSGVDPSLRLLGVYRGDSISGRIESVQSGAVTNSYWGTFVARRSSPDPTLSFVLRGLFDSVTTTDGQGHIATRAATSDSLRGSLTVDDVSRAPIGQLTVAKCGAACFDRSAASPAAMNGYTGAGTRRGDTVAFHMLWDLMSNIQLRGVYFGDSIVGTMSSYRGTSTSTTYTGAFVARRNP